MDTRLPFRCLSCGPGLALPADQAGVPEGCAFKLPTRRAVPSSFQNEVSKHLGPLAAPVVEATDTHCYRRPRTCQLYARTSRSILGLCFDLILRSASFAALLMSAAERSNIRFASLYSWGLIGRGLRLTPLPNCSTRMRNAAIRPNGLSLAGIRYHGANFVDVSSNMSSIATT
jgi:hypothetical protein